MDDKRYLFDLGKNNRGEWDKYCSDYEDGVIVLSVYE